MFRSLTINSPTVTLIRSSHYPAGGSFGPTTHRKHWTRIRAGSIYHGRFPLTHFPANFELYTYITSWERKRWTGWDEERSNEIYRGHCRRPRRRLYELVVSDSRCIYRYLFMGHQAPREACNRKISSLRPFSLLSPAGCKTFASSSILKGVFIFAMYTNSQVFFLG